MLKFSRRAGAALLLALGSLLVAGPAFAADAPGPVEHASVLNVLDALVNDAQFILIATGVVIPLLVGWLTKVNASGFLKGCVAGGVAGLGALATYLLNVDGAHTWQGAVWAFGLALVTAVAVRNGTPIGGLDTKIAYATPDFGLGKRAVEYVALPAPTDSTFSGTISGISDELRASLAEKPDGA